LQAVAEQIVRATHPERLGDLPLTNVSDEADHDEARNTFRTLLDSQPPLRDIRLFLSAYHSLLQSIVGYRPQLIPAYKLDCPVPFDFVLLVPEGVTGPILVQLITLGPLEGTAALPQLLADIGTSLGPRLPLAERAANAYGGYQYAGEYAPLMSAMQRLDSLLIGAEHGSKGVRSARNIHWDRPQVWQFRFLLIAGRRRTEGIDEEREAMLKSVGVPVEVASYDRLLD
jgi:hypothetical protein